MMDDEFDDLLRDASLSYNVPPEPPREAMWDAISRARDAAVVTPIAAGRRATRWLTTAAGIAAVLMIGVVIGRTTRDEPAPSPVKVAAAPETTITPVSATTDSVATATPMTERVASADAGTNPTGRRENTARTEAAERVATRVAARVARDRENRLDASGDATAYRLAVVEHLTRTELLLTSFRSRERTSAEVRADAQFSALSKELLGTTRVLLATGRNDDPVITRLLQDLEYVLMQLSQYSNEGRRTDLDAINQSIDKNNVLPKLRSNIPAGLASSGT